MSKIVVGMNKNPEIKPHKIDWGFLNIALKAAVMLFSQLSDFCFFWSFGRRTKRTAPIARPAIPIPIHNTFQLMPRPISGPTANCPADPPAMPNIWVAPINVAARDAGKFSVAI
jgi:hypothetical protein